MVSSTPQAEYDRSPLVSGLEALARVPLLQAELDRRAGLETGGLVTGYRGSPLAGFDKLLTANVKCFTDANVRLLPALNEEIGVSMLQGTQEAFVGEEGLGDGAFGFWYSKSPGVARSVDALRHANLVGTYRFGGVVCWVGDDPQAISSRYTHTSELLLRDACIPVLVPANPQTLVDLSIFGIALSRHSGLWVAVMTESDVLDSRQPVDLSPERQERLLPGRQIEGVRLSPGQLAIPTEKIQNELRLPRAKSFLSGIDWRTHVATPDTPADCDVRVRVIAAGQAVNQARNALNNLRIRHDAEAARVIIHELPVIWPIPVNTARNLLKLPCDRFLVIENSHRTITEQLRAAMPPDLETDLFWLEPLTSTMAATPTAFEIESALGHHLDLQASPRDLRPAVTPNVPRLPYFCAGCPCNRSTQTPRGALSLGGVGCHLISALAPEAPAEGFPQMGGEGANWIGQSLFSNRKHAFQDMGDGTFTHSGSLAVRAAVATETTITFRILVNGVVAMTGGQPVEGNPSPADIAQQLHADGVQCIWVVSDKLSSANRKRLPPKVRLARRSEYLSVQDRCAQTSGVSAIIYDSGCVVAVRQETPASKWAKLPLIEIDPDVCDGCDHCVEVSRCVAIDRIDTPLGPIRQIANSVCNKDARCLDADCPAMVTVRPANSKLSCADDSSFFPALGEVDPTTTPREILIAGIGGTGVLRAVRLLSEVAKNTGLTVSSYCDPGMSQRGGVVTGHIRLAAPGSQLPPTGRLPDSSATLLIATDPLTAIQHEVLRYLAPRDAPVTTVVGDLRIQQRQGVLAVGQMDVPTTRELALDSLRKLEARVNTIHHISITADNAPILPLLIAAATLGELPIPSALLESAVQTVAPDVLPFTMRASTGSLEPPALASHQELTARLTAYGDAQKTLRFNALIDDVARTIPGGCTLALRIAHAHYRLLAVKDAVEVANLLLRREASRDIAYHLRILPEWLLRRPLAVQPAIIRPLLRMVAAMRSLRNTPADPARWTACDRMVAKAGYTFETRIRKALAPGVSNREGLLAEICANAERIRGYGSVRRQQVKVFLAG
ncbi:MAG: DUF6537 domain-containing protein [Hyphomicrobiales bacterium]